jgi:hypothetical protein
MSPHEYAALIQAGWQHGSPVPSAFQQSLQAAALEASQPLPVDPTAVNTFTPPQEQALSSLPQEMRDELAAWIRSVQPPPLVGGGAAPPVAPTAHQPPPPPPPPPPPVLPPPGVATDDAIDFLRAVKGGPPFTREYTLFGGVVRVTFRQATMADSLLHQDSPIDRRLRAATVAVVVATIDGPRTMAIDQAPTATVAAIRTAFHAFESLLDRLTVAAGDASFWTAIAR